MHADEGTVGKGARVSKGRVVLKWAVGTQDQRQGCPQGQNEK